MAPPLEDDDFLPDILLRLSRRTTPRASSGPPPSARPGAAFSGRPAAATARALHGPRAPVFGVLHNPTNGELDLFVPPTASSSFRPYVGDDRRHRHIIECRHRRVLLYDFAFPNSTCGGPGYFVWDPITGEQHRIPNVMGLRRRNPEKKRRWDAHASFYSSDTGEWSLDHVCIHLDRLRAGGVYTSRTTGRAAAHVVGDSLYFVGKSGVLLRYRYGRLLVIDSDVLSVIQPPPDAKRRLRLGYTVFMASPENELLSRPLVDAIKAELERLFLDKVSFRLAMFRPFVGEVLVGKISGYDEKGLHGELFIFLLTFKEFIFLLTFKELVGWQTLLSDSYLACLIIPFLL
uniref:Uncharacterized protein n=1 Tax=Oryza rufipogon TaxID=4529 RepID=A0A0E0NY55_ORYRU